MASIRRRNGKYQVQIRVGSYSRSQSFRKLNDAKSWARKEEELAEEEKRIVSICRKTSIALKVELHVDNEIPHAEWIEILDSFINPALANIDEYYFKDIVPDKLSMPEGLKLKPVHYARLYTHKTRLSKIAKRYSR